MCHLGNIFIFLCKGLTIYPFNQCLSQVKSVSIHLRDVLDTNSSNRDLWLWCGFFPDTPVSSINKSDPHDITIILLMWYYVYLESIEMMYFRNIFIQMLNFYIFRSLHVKPKIVKPLFQYQTMILCSWWKIQWNKREKKHKKDTWKKSNYCYNVTF